MKAETPLQNSSQFTTQKWFPKE